MTPKKAYLVSLRDFVVFATNEPDAVDQALSVVQDGALSFERLTPDQLRGMFGSTYPPTQYDPDAELTCAEIADEMERAEAGERKGDEPL